MNRDKRIWNMRRMWSDTFRKNAHKELYLSSCFKIKTINYVSDNKVIIVKIIVTNGSAVVLTMVTLWQIHIIPIKSIVVSYFHQESVYGSHKFLGGVCALWIKISRNKMGATAWCTYVDKFARFLQHWFSFWMMHLPHFNTQTYA